MVLGLQDADLVVVGSGFYGLTMAERAAADGARVVVLDRRSHLGGNAWSEPDPSTGIEVHTYGSHIFHTSNERVWEYVTRFGAFNDYRHHVWTVHAGRVYPMPIGLATMTQFFGRHLTPDTARELVREQAGELGGATPGQPRGEGDQPDRAAAVRGVHPRLHRQAVADRPPRAAGADHHPAAGALHLRHPVLRRHPRGHPRRRLRRAAHAHGAHARRHGPHRRRLVRRPRGGPPGHTRRLHRPGRPVLRLPRRRPRLAHPRPRDRGPGGRRPPGHHGHELRRRGRPVHPGARVPALPPRAAQRGRPHRRDDRALALGAAGRRAVLPGRHARGPPPPAGLPRAHGARAGRPLRRTARQLPVPRHAHGDRLRPDGLRQRGRPGRSLGGAAPAPLSPQPIAVSPSARSGDRLWGGSGRLWQARSGGSQVPTADPLRRVRLR